LLANKIDIADKNVPIPPDFLPISAKTGENLDRLLQELQRTLTKSDLSSSEVWLLTEREKLAVERALSHINDALRNLETGTPEDLIAIDIRNALEVLGELNPAEVGEKIINEIFSRFCVGK
jgi:tRNA modification GTPase